jgi:hypothetical protein
MRRKMIKHQIIHDTRAKGTAASTFGAGFTLTVDEDSSTAYIFNWLKVKSLLAGKIETLSIIAHGRSRIVDGKKHGGFGVTLGRDGVTYENVSDWEKISGLCRYIVFNSCAMADTTGSDITADGKFLCATLAYYTQAIIVASDTIQKYEWSNDGSPLDLGAWEGTVYYFRPDGKYGILMGPRKKLKSLAGSYEALSGVQFQTD